MALFADLQIAKEVLTADADLSTADAEAFLRRARPAITFMRHLTDETAVPVGASKIGGRPDMASDIPWPIRAPYDGVSEGIDAWPPVMRTIYSEGWIEAYRSYLTQPAPLAFIAQFDLEGLSERAGLDPALPRIGRLLLFTDPRSYDGGATPLSAPWLQVLHDTTPLSEIIRHPTPQALQGFWENSPLLDKNVYGDSEPWSETAQCERLNLVDAISLPHDRAWQASDQTRRILRALNDRHLAGLEEATRSDYEAGLAYHGDQLGGHPMPVQDNIDADFERSTGETGAWRHLFTVQGETYLPQLMTDWRDGDLYVMDRPLPDRPDSIGPVWGLSQST